MGGRRSAIEKTVGALLVVPLVAMLVPVLALATPPPDSAHAMQNDTGRSVSAVGVASSKAEATKARQAASQGDSTRRYVDGQVIVRFKNGVAGTAAASAAHAKIGATVKKRFKTPSGCELVQLKKGMSVADAVAAYKATPGVDFAQPNYTIRKLATAPNDPLYGELWGFENTGQVVEGRTGTLDADVDADEAWTNHTAGDSTVVVAVIDTGVDYTHPDLDDNMWVNPGETEGNGEDGDGNGYIDDVHGADFVNGDGDPMDDNGHGTHCAGTIAAEGDNGTGVVGVDWDASIMALKIFDANGEATTAAILEAFGYAKAEGADVISCSWGGVYTADPAEEAAIAENAGALFVFAAGNGGDNNDVTPYYPASYNLANIVAVGASDNRDLPASFSDYGATSVDVFAPGVGITSTVPGATIQTPQDGVTVATLFEDSFSYANDAALAEVWDCGQSGVTGWALSTDTHCVRSAPTSIALVGYGNGEDSHVRTVAPLDLSTAANPWLEFYLGYDTEPAYDFVRWGLYDPGTDTEYELGSASGCSQGARLVQHLTDLSAYVGEDGLCLYFEFTSDGSDCADSGYVGAWVDDVRAFDLSADAFKSIVDHAAAYDVYSGTSMATPHVAGIAALLLAKNLDLTPAQLKAAIVSTVDEREALQGMCVSGGRVNANAALGSVSSLVAPVAATDSYATAEDAALTLSAQEGVLVNDTDADTSHDALTAVLKSGPTHGTLALNSGGGFTYAPDADWNGVDSFTYAANDGTTDSNVAQVEITVTPVNDAPVGVADVYEADENTVLDVPALGVLANDTDIEEDELHVATFVEATHGQVVVYTSGRFVYTPLADWAGTDSFQYRVEDKNGARSGLTAVTITVNPVAVIENFDAGVTFGRFVTAINPAFSGGSYTYAYSKAPYVGTRMEARFYCNQVQWCGPKQPNYGKAKVYIDGAYKTTVDCYQATGELSTVIYDSGVLTTDGWHTIWIEMADGKNAASTNYVVVIDKFVVKGAAPKAAGTRKNESAGTYLGGWVKVSGNPTYTDSSYAYSYWAGARFIVPFTGTKVSWVGPKVYNYGRAAVYIDGGYKGTVSQYAPSASTAFRAKVWESATLASGAHTFEIRPLATKDAASAGKIIVIDAIDVTP